MTELSLHLLPQCFFFNVPHTFILLNQLPRKLLYWKLIRIKRFLVIVFGLLDYQLSVPCQVMHHCEHAYKKWLNDHSPHLTVHLLEQVRLRHYQVLIGVVIVQIAVR
jgi:hypothetical protein